MNMNMRMVRHIEYFILFKWLIKRVIIVSFGNQNRCFTNIQSYFFSSKSFFFRFYWIELARNRLIVVSNRFMKFLCQISGSGGDILKHLQAVQWKTICGHLEKSYGFEIDSRCFSADECDGFFFRTNQNFLMCWWKIDLKWEMCAN